MDEQTRYLHIIFSLRKANDHYYDSQIEEAHSMLETARELLHDDERILFCSERGCYGFFPNYSEQDAVANVNLLRQQVRSHYLNQ